MIDQGCLLEAIDDLNDLRSEYGSDTHEGREARGLLGRVHKQAYANCGTRPRSSRLREAVIAYWEVYRDPTLIESSWWHGINVVACLARAERDGLPLAEVFDETIDWRDEARKILATVSSYDRQQLEYTWATGTAMEACIALEDNDVFELGSTERQLREIWQLDERDAPGAEALRVIQGRLGTMGGTLQFSPSSGPLDQHKDLTYQAQLGDEAARAVNWLDKICRRSRSVALITKDTDEAFSGTGFFVRATDLGLPDAGSPVLVTNHHVVNTTGDNGAIRSDRARIRLTRLEHAPDYRITEVIREFPDLDTTILAVERSDDAAGLWLPVGRRGDLRLSRRGTLPRLYVIGHPHGGALQITLHDNRLIELPGSDHYVRYRCPTEQGSSGSPVLSGELEVVAIHHATREHMVANQGVLFDSVRARIRN
jgi:Trypsin-like peptidase domain